jgi:hypothetical protein
MRHLWRCCEWVSAEQSGAAGILGRLTRRRLLRAPCGTGRPPHTEETVDESVDQPLTYYANVVGMLTAALNIGRTLAAGVIMHYRRRGSSAWRCSCCTAIRPIRNRAAAARQHETSHDKIARDLPTSPAGRSIDQTAVGANRHSAYAGRTDRHIAKHPWVSSDLCGHETYLGSRRAQRCLAVTAQRAFPQRAAERIREH